MVSFISGQSRCVSAVGVCLTKKYFISFILNQTYCEMLLRQIKNVNPENLSIREAYEFIDEIKQKASKLNSIKNKNNS